MSLAEENRKSLAARHPHVLEALRKAPKSEAGIEVLPTPSGDPTAARDGMLFHSRYNPRREAAAQAKSEIDERTTTAILLGFGLGYAAQAIREERPELPLLVIEPDAQMFAAAMDARDLSVLFSDERTSFLVGGRPEDITPVIESLPLESPAFIRLRPAVEANPGWYRAAEEVIRSWTLRREININTLGRFGRLWVRNLCRNMPRVLDAPGVARLEGLLKGFPALVLGGGPSFDEIAPFIGQLSQRFVIVSVNTPLKPCLEAGVRPDFTVVVDPQYWATRYLDWTRGGMGILVAEPSTHPGVFRRPSQLAILCSSLFPLGERLESVVGKKGKLGAGGSVATAAWDLARLSGCSPLYSAGLDLGFPGLRTHCRGAYVEDLWFSTCGRLAPVESDSFRYLRDIGIFAVRSAGGGAVMTDRRMLLYKWWFEDQMRQHPDLPCHTLSPNGTAIEGMSLASMEQALSLPIVRPQIDERLAAVREWRTERSDARLTNADLGESRLRETLRDMRQELKELEALAHRGLARTIELGRLLAQGKDLAACLRDLDRIDGRILGLSDRNIAGFLIQSLIHSVEGSGDRRTDSREILERSSQMYRGIADSAEFHRQVLGRALESL